MGNTDSNRGAESNGESPAVPGTQTSLVTDAATETATNRGSSPSLLGNLEAPRHVAILEVPPDTASPIQPSPAEPEAGGEEPAGSEGDHKPSPPAIVFEMSSYEMDTPAGDRPANDPARQGMVRKYGAALVNDMDDAQLLLSYITRNGLQEERKVDDETVQTLVAARQRLRTGAFDCEKEEASFRKSFGVLSRAAQPVSVVSLRDSLPTPPQRHWFFFQESEPRSAAERTCIRYRNYSMGVLFALLIIQVYWTICSSFLSQMPRLWDPKTLLELVPEVKQAAATFERPKAPAATPEPGAKAYTSDLSDLSENAIELLYAKGNEGVEMSRMLSWWLFKGQPSSPATFTVGPLRFDESYQKTYIIGSEVVDILQKWFLPLLYGALGAFVYVVRTLSGQARERTFRREAVVSLNLRVYLGMISGLAIGWFFNQDPLGAAKSGAISFASLSPFALAFVAGYAVELFFTALDRIVSAFTGKA